MLRNMIQSYSFTVSHQSLVALRKEIHIFPLEKRSDLAELICDDQWIMKLYFADIFSILNELHLKLQGRENYFF